MPSRTATSMVPMNGTIHRLRHLRWRRTGMEACPYDGGVTVGFTGNRWPSAIYRRTIEKTLQNPKKDVY